MSKTKQLIHFERSLEFSKKVINDLTKENYELKALLKEAANHDRKITVKSVSRSS